MWLLLSSFLIFSQASFVTSPANCLKANTYPCAVLTKGKTSFAHGGNGFSTSTDSVVSFSTAQDIFIVRGSFWITAKKDLNIKTSYGSFAPVQPASEFWLNANAEKQEIKVFSGSVVVTPKGGQEQEVSAGRQVYISSVDYSKNSCYISNVSVIDFQEHVRTYGNVFPFGFLSVEEHLQKVAGAVLVASSQDSIYLKKSVTRHLASEQEASVRQRLEAIEASRLEKYLRKLFRSKSNFEE